MLFPLKDDFHCPGHLAKWKAVTRVSPVAVCGFVWLTRLWIPQKQTLLSIFLCVFTTPRRHGHSVVTCHMGHA